MELNEYYPFGLVNQQTSSTQYGSKEQHYKYNGKELFKDFKLEMEDYGARMYSPQIGRWNTIDKMANSYTNFSPYTYVMNRPTVAVDPDGQRVYFIGGANNDKDGWNYIARWEQAFAGVGINEFVRVNASGGKANDIFLLQIIEIQVLNLNILHIKMVKLQ
jgi:RHS repeat-associated protein